MSGEACKYKAEKDNSGREAVLLVIDSVQPGEAQFGTQPKYATQRVQSELELEACSCCRAYTPPRRRLTKR